MEYERFSSLERLAWTMARVLSIGRCKSFGGGQSTKVTHSILGEARQILLKDGQVALVPEIEKGKTGKYRRLRPVSDHNGIVGSRFCNYNPLAATPDAAPKVLLPALQHYTCLAMRSAHVESGHKGRDSTLAQFRQLYWTPQGSKVASSCKNHCQMCRLRDPVLLDYDVGIIPRERLQPAPPFNRTMVDLFAPYIVRGEVQKRTTGKVYGAVFTDLFLRAVHIEVVTGYDSDSFLLALTRFTSIRGWPEIIFSDSGSQLVSAGKELKNMWKT